MNNFYLSQRRARSCKSKMILIAMVTLLSHAFIVKSQIPTRTFIQEFGSGVSGDGVVLKMELEDGFLFTGSAKSSPGPFKTAPHYGGADCWLIKTDFSFNRVWDKTYGGSGNDHLSQVIKTSDGGFLLLASSNSQPSGNKTAPFKSTNSEWDVWIVKISSNGSIQWDNSFGGNLEDVAFDVVETEEGGFIFVGRSHSNKGGDKSQDRYGPTGPYGPVPDMWVVKLNKNGVKEWDKTLGGLGDGGTGYDWGNSIIKTKDGNYLIGGGSDSKAGNDKSPDPSCPSCTDGSNDLDFWVIKIRPDGSKIWDKSFGGTDVEYGSTITINPKGEYTVHGESYSDISGNKTIAGNLYSHTWWFDIDEDGQKTNERVFDTPEANFRYLENMASDNNGYYHAYTTNDGGDASSRFIIRYYSWSDEVKWEWVSEVDPSLYLSFRGFVVTKDGRILFGTNEGSVGTIALYQLKPNGSSQPLTSINLKPLQDGNDVKITVSTGLPGYGLKKVEFFADNIKIGEDDTAPYELAWNNAPVKTSYLHVVGTNLDNVQLVSTTQPITVKRTATSLYRAINVNGLQVIEIDGAVYEGSEGAANFSYEGKKFSNRNLSFDPMPDAYRSYMLTSCIYATKTEPAKFNFTSVPAGPYEVYLYVMEDNKPATYSIWINGNLALDKFNSGQAKHWDKLGPFKTNSKDGKIEIKVTGGDGNVSGIELHTLNDYEELYRAVNVNGYATTVDNIKFERGASALDFEALGSFYYNQNIPLLFAPDKNKSAMIRSCVYSTPHYSPALISFNNVPAGKYDIILYTWEDNNGSTFSIEVNGATLVSNYYSGPAGRWNVLKGTAIAPVNGKIDILAFGGDGNISGVELWKRKSLGTVSKSLTVAKSSNIYPNPVAENTTLNLPGYEEGKVKVSVIGIHGEVYSQSDTNLDATKQLSLSLPLSKIKKGPFIIKVQGQNKTEVFRLLNE